MTIKERTLCTIVVLIVGVIGGIAGTAFSMGADKQRINDLLTEHNTAIISIKTEEKIREHSAKKELDNFQAIVASHLRIIQDDIKHLDTTVSNLRTDIQVLKALMERMENDRKSEKN